MRAFCPEDEPAEMAVWHEPTTAQEDLLAGIVCDCGGGACDACAPATLVTASEVREALAESQAARPEGWAL